MRECRECSGYTLGARDGLRHSRERPGYTLGVDVRDAKGACLIDEVGGEGSREGVREGRKRAQRGFHGVGTGSKGAANAPTGRKLAQGVTNGCAMCACKK